MIRQTMLKNHQATLNRLTDTESAFLDKFARFFHPGNYETITTFVNDALLHIERNGNGKIIFFDASLLISDVFRKEKFARTTA
jgi:DNA polymerase-3 subunit delta'